jgi:hypothetical protein
MNGLGIPVAAPALAGGADRIINANHTINTAAAPPALKTGEDFVAMATIGHLSWFYAPGRQVDGLEHIWFELIGKRSSAHSRTSGNPAAA